MLKEGILVGVAAATGTWVTQKYGSSLETQAAKLHIPPTVAHMAVVGGFTALAYFVGKAVL